MFSGEKPLPQESEPDGNAGLRDQRQPHIFFMGIRHARYGTSQIHTAVFPEDPDKGSKRYL